jgi:hypothetical protein
MRQCRPLSAPQSQIPGSSPRCSECDAERRVSAAGRSGRRLPIPRSATGGANGLNRRSGIAHTGNSRALRSHRSYCRFRSASYLLASRLAAAHRCFRASTGAARRLEMPPAGSYARGDPWCQLDLSRIPPPRLVWDKETLSGRDELRLLRLPARRKLRRLGSKL